MLVLVATLAVLGERSAASRAHGASSSTLTAPAADAALRRYVRSTTPHAVFPNAQGTYCPAVYIVGTEAQCYVEYHVGSSWSFLGATLWVGNGDVRVGVVRTGSGRYDLAGFYTHTTWQRRWVACPSPRLLQGTMESNNACGNGNGTGSDWFFATQLWTSSTLSPPYKFHFQYEPEVAWTFTDSAGYQLGSYFGTKHGTEYTYTDVVGDSFRYAP